MPSRTVVHALFERVDGQAVHPTVSISNHP